MEKLIVVGFDQESNRKALDLVGRHGGVFSGEMLVTLGVHPCDAVELTEEEILFIREKVAEGREGKGPRVVGIGETGLDFHHQSYPFEVQAAAFRRQIHLSKELDLPVIVHSREAKEETLKILVEEAAEKVIFHCYTYDYEFGKKVWGRGFHTSFSGVLTYPNAKDIQEAARRGPLDLFLIETDSPYLAPQSVRGQRNEPACVAEVGKKLAELRGVKASNLAEKLHQNFQETFS